MIPPKSVSKVNLYHEDGAALRPKLHSDKGEEELKR